MNPFKYGLVVSDKDFCPRPKLIRELSEFIKSGQNIMVQGERRIGKTSLIYETIRRLKKYRLIYVDLLAIKTSDDLCKRLIKALITLEQQAGVVDKIFKSIPHLRPSLSFDPLTGQPSISLDANVKLRTDSISGVLDLILKTGKKSPLVVVFDEFQDVLNCNDGPEALAMLRSKIQFHTKISYIFAGSVRNEMDEIFNHPDSPFFKSAIPINVGPLDKKHFSNFIRNKFLTGKRSIENTVSDKVFEIGQNVPGDIQQLCEVLWETTSHGDVITETNIPAALRLIFSRESKGYESIVVQVTDQQLKCLVGLARMGGRTPLSGNFIRAVGIPLPGSVKKALTRLVQLKIIFRHDREYRFVNPYFKAWLLFKNY